MGKALTANDIETLALAFKVPVAHIKAVAEVEAGPWGGFLSTGHPVVLFEPHWFHRLTGGAYAAVVPHLSYPEWGEKPYGTILDQPERLAEAARYGRKAALEATSWGLFQIMGFNWFSCGYDDLQDFINAMYHSEHEHLTAMLLFCKANDLLDFLRDGDWTAFARGYNGPGYATHRYDDRLRVAAENARGGA